MTRENEAVVGRDSERRMLCRKNWATEWAEYHYVEDADWEKWERHQEVDPEIFSDPTERLRRIFEIWHADDVHGPAEIIGYANRLIDQISEAGLEITIRETETVTPPTIHELTSAVESAMGLVTDQDDLLKRVREIEKETE